MKTRPTRQEINCETGQESIVPFTEEEMEQREKDLAALSVSQAENASIEKARVALLDRLGITAEEAALLVK